MGEVINLAAKRQELRPKSEIKSHVDDEVGQAVQSAVNMAITALENHAGKTFDGSYFIPMEGITHEDAAGKVWFELQKCVEVHNFDIKLLAADNRLADGLGHWVTEHHFLLEFIPQQKTLPPAERLKRIAAEVPPNMNHLP